MNTLQLDLVPGCSDNGGPTVVHCNLAKWSQFIQIRELQLRTSLCVSVLFNSETLILFVQNASKNKKLINIPTWSCLQSLVCQHIPGGGAYKGVNAPCITVLYFIKYCCHLIKHSSHLNCTLWKIKHTLALWSAHTKFFKYQQWHQNSSGIKISYSGASIKSLYPSPIHLQLCILQITPYIE